MHYAVFGTSWGYFGMVARGTKLVATYLPQAKARLHNAIKKQWPEATERNDLLPKFQKQVGAYLAGKLTTFDVDLDLSAVSPFRRKVLAQCRRIPFGATASYADLARAAKNPRAVRAVGGAMANNPLPLVIPCHRVLRSDGSIGGFSSPSGVTLKRRMLRHEKS